MAGVPFVPAGAGRGRRTVGRRRARRPGSGAVRAALQRYSAFHSEAEVDLAGRTFKIKKQFLDDLEFVNMQETLRHLDRALLIFHSPIDDIVGIENAAQIFQAARHPKSFISLDKANHLLSNVSDSRYVGTVIAAWSLKYVNGSQSYHLLHLNSQALYYLPNLNYSQLNQHNL